MRYFLVRGMTLALLASATLGLGACVDNGAKPVQAVSSPLESLPQSTTTPIVSTSPEMVVGKRWKAVGQPTEATRHNFSCKTNVLHYEFVVLAGNRLGIDTGANTYKEAPVGADGSVDYSFQSTKLSSLRVTGNINRPETMKVLNTEGSGCEWRLVPV